ncbi:MAG: thiamine-phosphate kinase [Terriglobales bacterium]
MPLPERKLIARVRRTQPSGATRTIVHGIGDDCAVLRPPPKDDLLVTTDFSLEGVHFRRDWHSAASVGHRCLTRGLSDIAAMGGVPLATFLSFALPHDLPQKWVDEFQRGFLRLARRFGTRLAGGDTAQSPEGVMADIVVIGSVPRGKAVLRSGARAGDYIFVTGTLGSPAGVLRGLQRAGKSGAENGALPLPTKDARGSGALSLVPARARRKFLYPEPRLEVGKWLREGGLTSAMIDISDGLSTDLSHICEESGVGAWLVDEEIPVASGATLEDALNGGDEYELLFTVRESKRKHIPSRIAGVPVHWIGTIVEDCGLWLYVTEEGVGFKFQPQGWEHFKK